MPKLAVHLLEDVLFITSSENKLQLGKSNINFRHDSTDVSISALAAYIGCSLCFHGGHHPLT
jgi:hypothetical protein